MRLTLRTLLAYRTGQLDEKQSAEIAARLARSPRAQQISRRLDELARRPLTAAFDGGQPVFLGASDSRRLDANRVSEYLSDDLRDDAIADFELHCMASDVQLDETSACAQILAAVFTQPVITDPALKLRLFELERMRDSTPISSAATVVWPPEHSAGAAATAVRPPPLPRRGDSTP